MQIVGSAGGASPELKKNRKQEVESRRESCTFGRGDQIAFIMTGENFRAVFPAP
jgi:hypothetical protein